MSSLMIDRYEHPTDFPHARGCTVLHATTEDMSRPRPHGVVWIDRNPQTMLDFADRLISSSQRQGTGEFVATPGRVAVLIFLDNPMELVRQDDARAVIEKIIHSAHYVGLYVAMPLTRDDQAEMATYGLMEHLQRHAAGGTVVYGNW